MFRTEGPVVIYPSSGTGAWEAAAVNTLSPGELVLMAETGHFATLWCEMAQLGLEWNCCRATGATASILRRSRRASPTIAGVIKRRVWCTTRPRPGSTSRVAGTQGARPGRPSGAVHGRHHLVARLDRLPAGRMGRRRDGRLLAEGPDAAARPRLQCARRQGAASESARLPKSYWDWQPMLSANAKGVFPYAHDQSALRPARGAFDAA